nr:hypothetical protein [Pseudaminobacter arsenicus]
MFAILVRRQHLAAAMPGLVAEAAGGDNILPAILTAIGSRQKVFSRALQIRWDPLALLKAARAEAVCRPHRKPAIKTPSTLLARASGSNFYQSCRFAHVAHPFASPFS